MDPEIALRIRALSLASRCLTREMLALQRAPRPGDRSTGPSPETERIVGLARTILDPTGLSHQAPPRSVSEGLLRALEPAAPLPASQGQRLGGLLSDAAPSNEHTLALYGHGTVLPIAELIGFLGTTGKSGILRVVAADQTFVLEFLGGDIVHGEATGAPAGLRLGDLLVAQGAIDRYSLEGALEQHPKRRLGQTLLEMRLIEKAHLTAALKTQIQWLFSRLFRTEVKSFTFWIGPPMQAGEGVRLNANTLLLEGARLSDEGNDGSEPSQDSRFSRAS